MYLAVSLPQLLNQHLQVRRSEQKLRSWSKRKLPPLTDVHFYAHHYLMQEDVLSPFSTFGDAPLDLFEGVRRGVDAMLRRGVDAPLDPAPRLLDVAVPACSE